MNQVFSCSTPIECVLLEPKDKITIVIADDHTIVRMGIGSLLKASNQVEIVGEASDGRMAIEQALEKQPDIILMDLNMPVVGGLEALRQIKKRAPHIKVIILSAYDDEEYVTQVVQNGANGFLFKMTSMDELLDAIKSVYGGHSFFPASASKIFAEQNRKSSTQTSPMTQLQRLKEQLTIRETEILRLIAQGSSHKQIAEILHISVRTVDTHRNNIIKKLDIHDAASLVKYAIQNGIVMYGP